MHRDKHKFLQFLILCVLFCAPVFAQEFKQIRDGIEHVQFTRQVKINDKETAPVVVNALRLDLKKTRLDVVHAMDAAIGVEKTSSIATRHGAFAAVNAGFFRFDNSIFRGDAAGVLQIDGKPLSESFSNRIALFINNSQNQTNINFEHLNLLKAITFAKKNSKTAFIDFEFGINRQRSEDDAVVYLPEFNRTTLTDTNGAEIIVKNNVVAQIVDGKGGSLIPTNGFVFSVSGSYRYNFLRDVKVGMKAEFLAYPDTEANGNNVSLIYKTAEDIVGGAPQLIKNGKIEITWREEKYAEKDVADRHPRTAVGKLKDGRALLVTVDGRQPGVSAGMNLQELAEMLLELGATDAMNLDGGGSTTMFLDGKVVNKPSDKEIERAVSDAILVNLRK